MSRGVGAREHSGSDPAWTPGESVEPAEPLHQEEADAPWQDQIFTLLSNQRRRFAWHYCRQTETPVELGEVAERVAAWENGKPVEAITSAERKRVYTSLQQSHLPKMDDADIVVFEDGTVDLGDAAEEYDVFLDVVPTDEVPWSEYYLYLSMLSGGLLMLVWAGIFPSVVPALGWAGAIVLAFGVSSAVHTYRNRLKRFGSTEKPPELP